MIYLSRKKTKRGSNIMKKNMKIFTIIFTLMFVFIVKVNATVCIDNCAAKIGVVKYDTIQEAITAVEEGGTVEILAGEFSEEIKTGRISKSFTIIGAANHATVLTGGLTVGTDQSSLGVQNYTVAIK